MNFDAIRKEMIAAESYENKAYICPAGKLTAGIGRNLEDVEFTDAEVEFMFSTDYSRVKADLERIFPDFKKWPEELQHIFFSMRFQLGPKGFRGFGEMIKAAQKFDLVGIEREMADSEWAKKDTPERARKLIERVRKLRLG